MQEEWEIDNLEDQERQEIVFSVSVVATIAAFFLIGMLKGKFVKKVNVKVRSLYFHHWRKCSGGCIHSRIRHRSSHLIQAVRLRFQYWESGHSILKRVHITDRGHSTKFQGIYRHG